MVDLSPGSDHSVGAVLVSLKKTILLEHDPTLSVPCSHGSLYGTKKKDLVATSTTA